MTTPTTKLILLCDGTGCNKNMTTDQQSNIEVLDQFLDDFENNSKSHYICGPGTLNYSTYLNGYRDNGDFLYAYSVPAKIKEAYFYIVKNYQPKMKFYFFGFSRGAYIVRALCGFIKAVGILDKASLDVKHTWTEWFDFVMKAHNKNPNIAVSNEVVSTFGAKVIVEDFFEFVGLFDTVPGVSEKAVLQYNIYNAFGPSKHPFYNRFCHILAGDEKSSYLTDVPLFIGFHTKEIINTPTEFEAYQEGSHNDIGGGSVHNPQKISTNSTGGSTATGFIQNKYLRFMIERSGLKSRDFKDGYPVPVPAPLRASAPSTTMAMAGGRRVGVIAPRPRMFAHRATVSGFGSGGGGGGDDENGTEQPAVDTEQVRALFDHLLTISFALTGPTQFALSPHTGEIPTTPEELIRVVNSVEGHAYYALLHSIVHSYESLVIDEVSIQHIQNYVLGGGTALNQAEMTRFVINLEIKYIVNVFNNVSYYLGRQVNSGHSQFHSSQMNGFSVELVALLRRASVREDVGDADSLTHGTVAFTIAETEGVLLS